MLRLIVFGIIFSYYINTNAQVLSGFVYNQKNNPLEGVSIYFLNTNTGTTTEEDGSFVLYRAINQDTLLLFYPGIVTDTFILSKSQNFVKLILTEGITLNEVTISQNRSANHFSLLNPVNIETLNSSEFRKAACCSLAESFQTSNAVDLSFTSVVTGNREIQFLGLRGLYTQQLVENRPVFTGILSSVGYDLIPGTWLNQINILKGASSAIYGAQSMTGAINISLKKPDEDHRIYANAYADYHGRIESNLHLNKSWSKKSHSGLYLHGSQTSSNKDHNHDHFYDEPNQKRLNGLLRNTFYSKNWECQLNVQGILDLKSSGELKTNPNPYKVTQKLNHFNFSGNLGYLGFTNPDKSIGNIFDLAYSTLNNTYGEHKSVKANESRFMYQMLYTNIYQTGMHKLNMGPTLAINIASEELFSSEYKKINYKEIIPGLFAEYQFQYGEIENSELKKWIVILSQRIEQISTNTIFWSPRISTRFNFNTRWTGRISGGRGYRHYRIFSDHLNYLANNRIIDIADLPNYESSWNYGLNLVGKPLINNSEIEINLDAYITTFQKQLIFDLDDNRPEKQYISFYGLSGNSKTSHIGATIKIPIIKRISLKLGGKWINSKTNYYLGYRTQPFVPTWRALGSLDWESNNKIWSINITGHFVGKMRLPDKTYLPSQLSILYSETSKPFLHVQSQINYLKSNFEIYLGCENMTNYTQHHAIIDNKNTSSAYFETSEVYAPLNGIKPYIGIKWWLK